LTILHATASRKHPCLMRNKTQFDARFKDGLSLISVHHLEEFSQQTM